MCEWAREHVSERCPWPVFRAQVKGGSVWQEVRQVEGTVGGRVPGRAGLCLWYRAVKPETVVEGINLQKPFCALLSTWDSVVRLWSPPV